MGTRAVFSISLEEAHSKSVKHGAKRIQNNSAGGYVFGNTVYTSMSMFLSATTMMAARHAFGKVSNSAPRNSITTKTMMEANMPFTSVLAPMLSRFMQRDRLTQPGKPWKHEVIIFVMPYANSSWLGLIWYLCFWRRIAPLKNIPKNSKKI
jgi:hypothetical protein